MDTPGATPPGRGYDGHAGDTGNEEQGRSDDVSNGENMNQTLHTAMTASLAGSTTSPPSTDPLLELINHVKKMDNVVSDLEIDVNADGKQLKIKEVGPILNQHTALLHTILHRNNELTKAVGEMQQHSHAAQVKAEKRIADLDPGMRRLRDSEGESAEDGDVEIAITRNAKKRRTATTPGKNKRVKTPKSVDQNKLTVSFPFTLQPVYRCR